VLLAGGCTGLSSGAGAGGSSGLPIVVFLGNGSAASLPPEEAAAWSWLRSRPELGARYVQLVDLAGADLPRQAVIWWHYAAEESLPSAAVHADTLAAVRRHLVGGGGVLLSLLAAPYVVALGFEEAPPDVVNAAGSLGADTELGGLRARPGHPLLARFWGGAFTAAGGRYPRRPVALYTGNRWPAQGAVWAVHQDERQLDGGTKVGLEYAAVIPGAGTLLTIGAHCYFADADNHNRPQLEQLVSDALHYLAGLPSPALPADGATATNAARGGEPAARRGGPPAEDAATPLPPVPDRNRRYWGPVDSRVTPAEITPTTLPIAADPQEVLNRIHISRTGPELTGYPATDTPFTLTSPQVVASGSQLGRVDELWVHPQRVLRGLRFGIARPGRGVTWIDAGGGQHTYIARPEGSELQYNDGDVELGIHLAVDRRYPALVAVLSVRSPAPLALIAAWEIDRTASWPRDGSLDGPLELGWDDGAGAAVWRDGDGNFAAMAGFGHPPAVHVLGYRPERDLGEAGLIVEPAPQVEEGEGSGAEAAGGGRGVAAQISLAAGTTLVPFVAVGGDAAALDIDEAFAALVSAPGLAWVGNYNHFRGFLGNDGTTSLLNLGAPNQSFKDAFVWAKVGLESLRTIAPGVGAGMLSAAGGPAATDPAAPTVPELGGTGALWGAMAADAYGGRATAADTLRLMARYQGIDGRLPSAVSPSREVRYNVAATTPLFVIAVENHVRTWGDRALLGELWPAITRALDYGAAADRNEDGLIDGYGAADRWGGGPEVLTPIDLAALWGAALEAGARLAEWQGDAQRATAGRQGADRVREILNQEYWDPNTRNFSFAKRRDGTFDSARTALPAVPIMFRLLQSTADAALDQLAGAELSTDWGVGLAGLTPPAAEGSPAAGAGPHALADRVDPLFTGWAALAEFDRHRADAGFAHTLANLQLLGHGNLGRVPAALGRDRFEVVAGASHSAASQALTILPVMWGLLGIRADAMDTAGGTVGGTLTVAPHLPAAWDEITVAPVRIGTDELRVRVRRRASQTQFYLTHLKGNTPLRLRLSAHVPNDVPVHLNRDLVGATLEGDEVIEESSADRSSTAVVRTTATESIVTFDHGEYPQLIAPQVIPQPGAPSQGLRVIRSGYLGGVMSIEVEGLPGTAYTLRLRAPWRIAQVTGVPNPTIGQLESGPATIQIVIPGSGARYRRVNLEVSFAR
jgi:hypothetical protein